MKIKTDGIPDILMLIATKILELLQQNIDSLNIPKIVKKALEKFKEVIFIQQKNAEKQNHSSSHETLFIESKSRESSSSGSSQSSGSNSSSSSSSSGSSS